MKEIALFVGHGSRDADGNREFLEFVDEVRRSRPDQRFEACFLELAAPTVEEGIDACVRLGADRIVVVPVILLAASHVKLEIPEFLDASRRRHPNVQIVYGRNIGLHERILDLLSDRFHELADGPAALEALSGERANWTAGTAAPPAVEDPAQTAIVLMGRGSSDPDANGDVYKLARQLWERTGVLTVETCFTGITFPRLPEGVRRAVALGARRVAVVPYFLFTGVLIKRMRGLLEELRAEYPSVPMAMSEYFGKHRTLVDIVLDRWEEARSGQAFMNCDLCQYRLEAVGGHSHGHAHDHGHSHDHGHDHGRSPRRGLDGDPLQSPAGFQG